MSGPREALAGLVDSPRQPPWAERRPHDEVRDAGVLLLFGAGTEPQTAAGRTEQSRLAGIGVDGADILLLQRSTALRHHPGQVAFPGGAREDSDADIRAAALREAVEETGLDPRGVDIVGSLAPCYVWNSHFDVTPVLAWWREESPIGVADPGESDLVARVAIADLTAAENRGMFHHPQGLTTPAFAPGPFTIWGFTAFVLDYVLGELGWAGPWDADHRIEIDHP